MEIKPWALDFKFYNYYWNKRNEKKQFYAFYVVTLFSFIRTRKMRLQRSSKPCVGSALITLMSTRPWTRTVPSASTTPHHSRPWSLCAWPTTRQSINIYQARKRALPRPMTTLSPDARGLYWSTSCKSATTSPWPIPTCSTITKPLLLKFTERLGTLILVHKCKSQKFTCTSKNSKLPRFEFQTLI